jgi:hypothetical protein
MLSFSPRSVCPLPPPCFSSDAEVAFSPDRGATGLVAKTIGSANQHPRCGLFLHIGTDCASAARGARARYRRAGGDGQKQCDCEVHGSDIFGESGCAGAGEQSNAPERPGAARSGGGAAVWQEGCRCGASRRSRRVAAATASVRMAEAIGDEMLCETVRGARRCARCIRPTICPARCNETLRRNADRIFRQRRERGSRLLLS